MVEFCRPDYTRLESSLNARIDRISHRPLLIKLSNLKDSDKLNQMTIRLAQEEQQFSPLFLSSFKINILKHNNNDLWNLVSRNPKK